MFCSDRHPALLERVRGALELTSSLLLLEDDYDVDWEVDEDERAGATADPPVPEWAHPHRVPLGARRGPRRPGTLPPRPHTCLCPVPLRAAGRSRPESVGMSDH